MNHPLRLLLLSAGLTLPASALEIRSYNPVVHDRFIGFSGGGQTFNPTFIYDSNKFTGLGWFSSAGAHRQPGLVSPRHLVWATHHVVLPTLPVVGETVKFQDISGTFYQRTVTAMTAIASDTPGLTDLSILTLDSPLPATVKPFRYLNLPDDAAYVGTPLMVFGFQAKAGQGAIAGFDSADFDGPGTVQGPTKLCRFDYSEVAGQADDSYLIGGDSGTPSFASVLGEPAIVGTHSTFQDAGTIIQNYDTFVPHYASRLDTQMASFGYRMRPAHYTASTLSLATATVPIPLRQAYAGTVNFTFGNTGGQLTGNAELTLAFAPGEAPTTLTATGWVVESTGSGSWSIRKATMAAAEQIVVTANWTAMPNVATLTVNAALLSDTATTTTVTPSITLNPTYAAWASGLSEPAQGDDPDDDGFVNLLEYAFGGSALSGSMFLPSGDSLLPQLTHDSVNVTLSYPERSDAVVRGLSYQVETATDLASLTGAVALPVGAASSTQAYVPDAPGFVKRTITWPADGPARFARVKVTLSE